MATASNPYASAGLQPIPSGPFQGILSPGGTSAINDPGAITSILRAQDWGLAAPPPNFQAYFNSLPASQQSYYTNLAARDAATQTPFLSPYAANLPPGAWAGSGISPRTVTSGKGKTMPQIMPPVGGPSGIMTPAPVGSPNQIDPRLRPPGTPGVANQIDPRLRPPGSTPPAGTPPALSNPQTLQQMMPLIMQMLQSRKGRPNRTLQDFWGMGEQNRENEGRRWGSPVGPPTPMPLNAGNYPGRPAQGPPPSWATGGPATYTGPQLGDVAAENYFRYGPQGPPKYLSM